MKTEVKRILQAVQNGEMSVDDALLKLKAEPYEDIGFAKVDHHRRVRQGVPEVIYGGGKTAEQMIGIMDAMRQNGQERILLTRLSAEAAREIEKKHPITYYENAKIGLLGGMPEPDGLG